MLRYEEVSPGACGTHVVTPSG